VKRFLAVLNRIRRELWRALSGDPETSWVSHFLLVALGTFPAAALAAVFWGKTGGTLTAFALSELWLLFMAGREVVDYLMHTLAHDPPGYVRDGIGDLIGPVVVHAFCWAGLVALILG
jgi:hypothetical protein